jgi:hypothetical protein
MQSFGLPGVISLDSVAVGLCCVMSFLYFAAHRLPASMNAVVWGPLFATIAVVFVTAYYAYSLAGTWAAEEPQIWFDESITATRIASYVLFGLVGGILVLLMICLRRKQIQLAIGCVEEAGKAVTHMPAILFVPVVQACGIIIFMVMFLTYGIYLASQGQLRHSIGTTTSQSKRVGNYGTSHVTHSSCWYHSLYTHTHYIAGPHDCVLCQVCAYNFDDYIYYALWYLLFPLDLRLVVDGA